MNASSYRFGDRVVLISHELTPLIGMSATVEEVVFSHNPIDMRLRISLGSWGGEPIETIVSPGQVEKL